MVGGWQVANIVSVSSGNWYTVLDSNGNFANADGGAGGVSQRPDQVGDPTKAGPVAGNPGCVAPSKIRTPAAWFNTCAFGDPALGSFGDVGRNTIESPGYTTWDLSGFKNFRTTERTNLEFRSEFFNAFNHASFSGVGSPGFGTFGSPGFGIVAADIGPRVLQVGAKFHF